MKRYRVNITAILDGWRRDRIGGSYTMASGPCSAATIVLHRESEWQESQGNSIVSPIVYVYEVKWSANLSEYINWAPPVAVYECGKEQS